MQAIKLIILFAAILASRLLQAQPASPASVTSVTSVTSPSSPTNPPANLATNRPLYVTQMKHLEGPDLMPADYAYVNFGTNKFGFVMPAGYHLETQDSQKVTLVSADVCSLLTFRVFEPLPPGVTELDPVPYRSLLLDRRHGGRILEEFSLVAASRRGPAFDLSWNAPGPVARCERVLLIPSDAGVLEFSLVSSQEQFEAGRRGFEALLRTFRAAGEDGRLAMPVMSNHF
jgi:hypothetical protein